MKRFIYYPLFLLMIVLNPMDGNSQGSLQFNKVLLVGSLDTVPIGKVWKVEGLMYNGGAPYPLSQAPFIQYSADVGFYGLARFSINNQTVDIPSAVRHNSTVGISSPTALSWFPMWLPANTTLQPVTNIRYFHVIEFNIIP